MTEDPNIGDLVRWGGKKAKVLARGGGRNGFSYIVTPLESGKFYKAGQSYRAERHHIAFWRDEI